MELLDLFTEKCPFADGGKIEKIRIEKIGKAVAITMNQKGKRQTI